MKRLFAGLLLALLVSTSAHAVIRQYGTGTVVEAEHNVAYVLNGKTSTGDSEVFTVYPNARTFSAKVVGTGAVTATIIVYVSNTGDDDDWTTAATFTLSGTTSDSDGFAMNAKWAYTKANVSAITGTSAAVTVTMGV